MNKEDKEREGGREGGTVGSSLSSVEVERTDALELPGTNSSSSRDLFLVFPSFRRNYSSHLQLNITKADGVGAGELQHVPV